MRVWLGVSGCGQDRVLGSGFSPKTCDIEARKRKQYEWQSHSFMIE